MSSDNNNVESPEWDERKAGDCFPVPPPRVQVDYPEEGRLVQDVFLDTVKRCSGGQALHFERGDEWQHMTWDEYEGAVRRAARAMMSLGVSRGQGICVQSFNCPEYFFALYGVVWAGGYGAGIYTTNTAQQTKYVALHSESRVAFVENVDHLRKFLEVKDELPHCVKVVQMLYTESEDEDPLAALTDEERTKAEGWVISWKAFMALGDDVSDEDLDARMQDAKPTDLAALIYTSGTTGDPKAVMLDHVNITFASTALTAVVELDNDSDHIVSFLPLSHIAAQVLDLHGPAATGGQVWFARPDALKGSLLPTIKHVRPTFFFGVPRVWEKFSEAMRAKGRENGALAAAIGSWAKGVGLKMSYATQNGTGQPWFGGVASALVHSKVKAALGLDRCRYFYSAAAPLALDTAEYFMSLGIQVIEAYGMSESTGLATISLPDPGRYKVRTVGQRCPGVEVEIDEETGEIKYRGPNVFKGYYKNEKATKETIDEDGWLHSGDKGAFDEHGFLKITGRIKELIITGGGENVPPLVLEEALVSIPVISQAVAIGDRRKFMSALITLDEGSLSDALAAAGSEAKTVEEAATDEKFYKWLMSQIDAVNKDRMPSRAAYIRKVHIVPHEFTIDGGELTPTHKIKRRIINSKYADEIEAIYA